jgi:membrane associated rhomboid family serine protease
MAQEMSNRGGQLTPGQAREGHRWIRLTVLAAVLQAWMMAAVVALIVPRLLGLFLALGVAYSLAAPVLSRYLNRDVERRVITGGVADGFARFAHTSGLPSSSALGTPPR